MGKSVYITAVVATIAILLLIFMVVKIDANTKAYVFNEEIRQISLESELHRVYEDFDIDNKEVYCTVIEQSINSLSKRTDDLERQLNNYRENTFHTREFYYVKRNYLISNMILLRNFEKAREYCDFNTVTVLFFYAEDNSCEPECSVIGSQLSELGRNCNSFKNFNFPFAWETYEFTKILEVKHSIERAGTLVIDGNVYEEVLEFSVLSEKLGCS